jgi:hypothetical protein
VTPLGGSSDSITRCLEAHAAEWFGGGGRRTIADRVGLRQANMAIALAVSRWLELADGDDALARMHAWVDEVEKRAVQRGAEARADAFRRVRAWLDSCP